MGMEIPSLKIVDKIKIEKGPHYLLLNPEEKQIIVSCLNGNCIQIIDENEAKVIKSAFIPKPYRIILDCTSKKMYAMTNTKNEGTATISIIDTDSGKILSTTANELDFFDVNLDTKSSFVFLSLIYHKIISVINSKTSQEYAQIALAGEPYSIGIDPKSRRIFSSLNNNTIIEIDNNTHQIFNKFDVEEPGEILINPQHDILYLLHRELFEVNDFQSNEYDRLYAIDLNSKQTIKRLPEKKRSWLDKTYREKGKGHNSICVNGEGNTVFFSDEKKNEILILDKNLNLLNKIKMPKFSKPHLTYNSNLKRLYLSSAGKLSNSLYILQYEP
jgi:DNA-binding beta-propeller fold protein YncE